MRTWIFLTMVLVGCGTGQDKIDPFASEKAGNQGKAQRTVKECPAGYDPLQFRTDPGKLLPGGLAELKDGAYQVTSEEFLVTIQDRRRTANFHYVNGRFPCTNLGPRDIWGIEVSGPVSWRKDARGESSVQRNYQFSFDGTTPLVNKQDGLSFSDQSLAEMLRFYDDARLFVVELDTEWELRVVKRLDMGPRRVQVQGAFRIRH